ncbi:hypothetical protein GXP67_23170 [Rhodocytophaga rosea]|uniref:Uncharacterized protein n=1 Tax=Rhodocytophaga rosea TaxID=2704465 RepID=A0A6C0GP16_9BACT|nr:hypothetical protein [Rhodocytophaga rosea]QHT69332.1 hypothetical protein GXP67_23170 [Rhodocytophaga rosea]
MNQYLNTRERELVKAAVQFKKRAQNLIKSGKLAAEHGVVAETCDRLLEQVYSHAENRLFALQQHENLKKSVQDNAQCPRCKSKEYLKLRGVDVSEKGWKMNKYFCRRCHIEFVWNRPNNPWDMLKFMEDFIQQLELSMQNPAIDEETKGQTRQVKEHMEQNLAKLIPVIENADKNLQDVKEKDEQMAQMLHEFKNYLLIEKIKLDTWENQQH